MKKIITAFTSLLVFFNYCAVGKEKREDKSGHSLLWKITRKDLKEPSYLFGTLHLLCARDYVWTPVMQDALNSCQEVCFEMDMDDPSVMTAVAAGMMDPDGKPLKEYFSEEQYRIIEHFITDSLGMDMMMFQQMKPAALQMLFSSSAVSCENPVSYETNIMREATANRMSVSGLETPGEQLDLLNNMPADSLIYELVETAKHFSKERQEYNKMLEAYKNQNLPRLYELIMTMGSESRDLNLFLDERNKKWLERMEGKMEQQPVFFAVGAGHLPGPSGLIALLRKEGFYVEPVK